jgi:hypothetical protein
MYSVHVSPIWHQSHFLITKTNIPKEKNYSKILTRDIRWSVLETGV